MDAYRTDIVVLRRPSSLKAFGADALLPPAPGDHVPAHLPRAPAELAPEPRALLVLALERLLATGDFATVLELPAGRRSLVPPWTGLEVGGLGPDLDRMRENPRLASRVAHDLDVEPRLPLDDGQLDAVLVTPDVGKLRRPLEVFRDIGRVLRPEGVVAVAFGPASYDPSSVRLWALADDRERMMLAESFIEFADVGFTRPTSLTLLDEGGRLAWHEGPRASDDPPGAYAHLVFAYRDRVDREHRALVPFPPPRPQPSVRVQVELDAAGRPVCPYCGEPLGRYAPPVTVFEIDYGVDELRVCFNDLCDYYRRSRDWMRSQGHVGFTYRFMLNPETGATGPIPDDLSGGLKSCRIDG